MKYLIFILLLLVIINACSYKSSSPLDIIPENQFVSLLIDIHLADASLNILQMKDSKLKITADDYYFSVLKKHNTNKRKFDKSLEYYSKDLVKYNKIYDEVLKNLSILEGNLSKKAVKIKTK